jgi:hypothetical protein
VVEGREVALAPAAQLAVELMEGAVHGQHEPRLVASRLLEVLAVDGSHHPSAHPLRAPEQRRLAGGELGRARVARVVHGGKERRDGGRGVDGLAGLLGARAGRPLLGRREALDGGEVAPAGLAEHPGAGWAAAEGTDTHAA